MFGSIYSNHKDYLKQSFCGMNDAYRSRGNQKESTVFDILQTLYIKIFGVPEIGFQVRYFHFRKALDVIGKQQFNQVLDAGSGIGCYTLALARHFNHSLIIGVDNSRKNVAIGKKMAQEAKLGNVYFKMRDIAKELPGKDKYDLIICIDVLEHIKQYKKVLSNFYKVLRPGGYVYIHVPQKNQKRFFKKFRTWSHKGHEREGFVPTVFKRDMKSIGFHVVRVWNTFGFFGSITWELNHLALSKSFVLSALTFPLLLPFSYIDRFVRNKRGLAAAYVFKKT